VAAVGAAAGLAAGATVATGALCVWVAVGLEDGKRR